MGNREIYQGDHIMEKKKIITFYDYYTLAQNW